MADIGLHRADRQRLLPNLPERPTDRSGLDRITGRRAGAVHLEKRQIVRRHPGAVADRLDQRRLRRIARHRQPDRASVGIDAGAADHGSDRVAIGQRLLQGLQQHDAAALAADISVGTLVERKATPAARQHRRTAKAEKRIWRQQQVDAADDRAADALLAQRLARRVQRDERG